MSSGPTSGQLLRLSRAAHAAARRQRFNAALRRLVRLLPIPLAYALLARALMRWLEPGPDVTRLLWGGFFLACLAPLGGVAGCWLARRSPHAGALALDRHHQSADRITNALEFAKVPAADQSAFMQAAIADALLAVERPNAAAAVPIELPRGAGWSAALAIGVVAASFIKPHPPAPPERAPAVLAPIDPVLLSADDLSFLRESVEEFRATEGSPELEQAVADFNRLVEEMAERKLERRELFRRLAEIERSLATGPEADEALEAGLRGLAEQLDESPMSRPIADALKAKRLDDAEKAMRELAERLAREREKIEPAELERLRKALEAASSEAAGRVERLAQMRREVEAEQRRLLRKKGKSEAASPEGKAEQERQKRRLERLDRDIADAERSQEKMSELDKELAKAARELMRELGKSAEHLRSGAEDMNRMARQKMSDQEKRELKKKLEELRELLRQGGAGREQHLRRLQQFAERARGSRGEGGGKPGKPGRPGQNGRLTLGPGGTPLPLPGSGSPSPGGDQPGGGDRPAGGTEAGSGSGPEVKGEATHLEGKTEDVTAAAVDTGQGPASSEVVYGAAESGFTGARYQKVYTQYRTVAEDVLERDAIPAGYEFYVRRYFQLIRPRHAE